VGINIGWSPDDWWGESFDDFESSFEEDFEPGAEGRANAASKKAAGLAKAAQARGDHGPPAGVPSPPGGGSQGQGQGGGGQGQGQGGGGQGQGQGGGGQRQGHGGGGQMVAAKDKVKAVANKVNWVIYTGLPKKGSIIFSYCLTLGNL